MLRWSARRVSIEMMIRLLFFERPDSDIDILIFEQPDANIKNPRIIEVSNKLHCLFIKDVIIIANLLYYMFYIRGM